MGTRGVGGFARVKAVWAVGVCVCVCNGIADWGVCVCVCVCVCVYVCDWIPRLG